MDWKRVKKAPKCVGECHFCLLLSGNGWLGGQVFVWICQPLSKHDMFWWNVFRDADSLHPFLWNPPPSCRENPCLPMYRGIYASYRLWRRSHWSFWRLNSGLVGMRRRWSAGAMEETCKEQSCAQKIIPDPGKELIYTEKKPDLHWTTLSWPCCWCLRAQQGWPRGWILPGGGNRLSCLQLPLCFLL